MPTPAQVRRHIIAQLSASAERIGFRQRHFDADVDLVKTGLVDSMAFVDLVEGLERHFGIQLDLEDIEVSTLTSLNGLSALVASAAG